MSKGGAQPCLAFFQGTEKQKKGGRHWQIGVQPAVATGTKTVCDPNFFATRKSNLSVAIQSRESQEHIPEEALPTLDVCLKLKL
jgi:hypothetical protein